jgi:hypothetical protein
MAIKLLPKRSHIKRLGVVTVLGGTGTPIFLSVVGAIAKATDAPVLSSVILVLISPSQRRLFYF